MAAAKTKLQQYGVDVYLTTTSKQWRRVGRQFLSRPEVPDTAGLTTAVRHTRSGHLMAIVIWLDPKHPLHAHPSGVVDTCAHEAWHATHYLLDAICEPREKWQEQPAYLIGWLTSWLWSNVPKEIR